MKKTLLDGTKRAQNYKWRTSMNDQFKIHVIVIYTTFLVYFILFHNAMVLRAALTMFKQRWKGKIGNLWQAMLPFIPKFSNKQSPSSPSQKKKQRWSCIKSQAQSYCLQILLDDKKTQTFLSQSNIDWKDQDPNIPISKIYIFWPLKYLLLRNAKQLGIQL